MSPYEQAKAVYDREPCARSFAQDLELHMRGGFVFSRPDFFVMGRPVISTMQHAFIVNPAYRFHSAECDCWHVYLFAGNIARAWGVLPWPLPLFSWERKNELRFYPESAIHRLSPNDEPLPVLA